MRSPTNSGSIFKGLQRCISTAVGKLSRQAIPGRFSSPRSHFPAREHKETRLAGNPRTQQGQAFRVEEEDEDQTVSGTGAEAEAAEAAEAEEAEDREEVREQRPLPIR